CRAIVTLWLCSPPRYTLLPYTTLFRSRILPATGAVAPTGPGRARRVASGGGAVCAAGTGGRGNRPGHRRRVGLRPLVAAGRARADRKSTRLNSSHVKSSYAVFCLKKKS